LPAADNLATWLNRSRTLPLSISFTASGAEHYASSLLPLLIQHSSRWKDISLNLTQTLSKTLLAIPQGVVPLLETITIEIQRNWDMPRFVWSEMDFLQTAPRLRNAGFMGWSSGRQVLPWSQLTHLRMVSIMHTDHDLGMTEVEALETLSLCSNLQFCSLNLVPSQAASKTFDQAVTITSLESLQLHAFCDSYIKPFLDHITVPNVCDVEICTSGGSLGPWPQEEVTSLLSRASSTMKRLALHEAWISTEQLVQCLRLLPSLVTFSFRDSGPMSDHPHVINSELLEALTPEPCASSTLQESQGLGRALEAIDLKLRYPLSEKALQSFLQSRRGTVDGVAKLRWAKFDFDRRHSADGLWPSYPEAPERFPLPDTNWEFTSELREAGMDLSIVYEGYDVVSG
jgi:hypothetical protein